MSPRTPTQFTEMRELTKSKIESSALSLFSRQGLSVTVAAIAKHAGVSQGLLYQHYSSKSELIQSLVNKAIFLSSSAISDVLYMNATAKEKVEYISKMMLDMIIDSDNPGKQMFMFMTQVGINMPPDTSDNNDVNESNKPIYSLIGIIHQGQAEGSIKPGDPFALSLFYWATVQGLCCYSLGGIEVPYDYNSLSKILLK